MSESTGFGAEGMDQLLTRTREALSAMRAGRTAGAGDAEPAQGVGTASDEQIRVTVVAPGRVSGVEIDPLVMRRGSEELAANIALAVNAALDDLRSKAAESAGGPDLDALNSQLADLHEDSVRQMAYFTSAATSAIAQIRARGGQS